MKRNNTVWLTVVASALILVGCGGGSTGTDVKTDTSTEVKPAGWYGQTKVSAELDGEVYQHSKAGIFGVLQESDDIKDKHDIPGYGVAKLQIVFPQTTWEEGNGNYFTDYRYYNPNKDLKQVWLFEVRNDYTEPPVNLTEASLKIELDGIYDVTYAEKTQEKISYATAKSPNVQKRASLTLLDLDNQRSYTVDELQNAGLSMDGMHVRTFKWVMGTVEESDYKMPVELLTAKSSSSADFSAKSTDAPSGQFGRPPSR